MAGVTINQIQKETEMEKIVRVMPNTPAQISKGMSVWTNTKEVEKLPDFERTVELQSRNASSVNDSSSVASDTNFPPY